MGKPDIELVLQHYGAMTPSPRTGWQPMRCYVHEDSEASASVNYEANRWACFVCDINEDSWDIIQREESCAWSRAVELGKEEFGAGDSHVPERTGGTRRRLSGAARTARGGRASPTRLRRGA